MNTMGLKLAKASEEDFEKTRIFLQFMEFFFDSRNSYSLSCDEDKYEDLDNDDEDKKLILGIRKQLAIDEDCDPDEVDNRIVMYEAIRKRYQQCDMHWSRVFMAASVLMDNCTDPTESTIEFHPFISRAMDNSMLGE